MIPRNPFPDHVQIRKFPPEVADRHELTWIKFIVGHFDDIHWYESFHTDTSDINIVWFQPGPFPEKLNQHHLQFFQTAVNEGYINPSEDCKPSFYPCAFWRFDLWTLYNYQSGDIDLDCGGTMNIEALPRQKEINDVPLLKDRVPYDVPLIYGPPLSTSNRPFGR